MMPEVKVPEVKARSSVAGPEPEVESRLLAVLEAFLPQAPGVRGVAVADDQGLPLATAVPDPLDPIAVTAMSSLVMRASRTVLGNLGLRDLKAVVLEGAEGTVAVCALGGGRASLLALAHPDANVGIIKHAMAATARRLERELGFIPASGGRVLEVFLLGDGGLLVSRTSDAPDSGHDGDVVAAMFSAVGTFVEDAFRGRGGMLEEMELAHLRIRFIRGRTCSVIVTSSGSIGEAYVAAARAALESFEAGNGGALDPWDGDLDSLQGVDRLLETLLRLSPA